MKSLLKMLDKFGYERFINVMCLTIALSAIMVLLKN
jgi:hypothetical protein